MNRNEKRMKHEATRLTEAQRCESIAKLRKPNAPSKQRTFDDANKEYCVVTLEDVDEDLETMRIEEEPPINEKIELFKIFVESEIASTSKALKLSTTMSLTSTTNCFAPMFKRKLDKCMINCYDRLRRFSETLTTWHWMSSVKKSCIRGKWLCMTCSNNETWTLIFVKKIAHLTRMRT